MSRVSASTRPIWIILTSLEVILKDITTDEGLLETSKSMTKMVKELLPVSEMSPYAPEFTLPKSFISTLAYDSERLDRLIQCEYHEKVGDLITEDGSNKLLTMEFVMIADTILRNYLHHDGCEKILELIKVLPDDTKARIIYKQMIASVYAGILIANVQEIKLAKWVIGDNGMGIIVHWEHPSPAIN